MGQKEVNRRGGGGGGNKNEIEYRERKRRSKGRYKKGRKFDKDTDMKSDNRIQMEKAISMFRAAAGQNIIFFFFFFLRGFEIPISQVQTEGGGLERVAFRMNATLMYIQTQRNK